MDKRALYQVSDDVWLDAQRALWIESQRLLAVADLHLGYPWVHRSRGQLLPLAPDDTAQRLLALRQQYQPDKLLLLGDIVHGVNPIPAVREAFRELVSRLTERGQEVVVLAGNHDRGLSRMVERDSLAIRVEDQFRCGRYTFLHGDSPADLDRSRTLVMGHEHPAIRLGDGVTAAVKYPCFLISEAVIVLPAFSHWAAGSPVGANSFMSEIPKRAQFTRAVAVVGGRLLPVSLP